MKKLAEHLKVDKNSICITGYGLIMRVAKPEDAELILKHLNPKTVKKFSFFSKVPTLEDETRYLTETFESRSDLLFVIKTSDTDEFVGTIGLHEIEYGNETARIGIILFNTAIHGKGFAGKAIRLLVSYAFHELGLHKIYLNVFEENEHSRGIYRHLGFREEGVLRGEYKLCNEYKNLIRMAAIREEWTASQKNGE